MNNTNTTETGQHNGAECNPELAFQNVTYTADVQEGSHQSLQSSPTSPKQPTEDMQLFIPELVENCAEDRNRCEYRFLCPHAGQFVCKLTNLVFEMEGKGEVQYSIVSWDSHVLDGISQKEPAGPLYSIDCLEGSILYLHLPHCETRTDVVDLSVAHVTGGNVEFSQLLKVTNTHAVIQINGLSHFGFLKALLYCQAYPIKAQVLLFYEKYTGKPRMSKLHIHLLPESVPVGEKQHEFNTYIVTSSKCQLTPGIKYRPCCKTADRDHVSQPEDETFDCDYNPNYHPTFEVLFSTEVNSIRLSLLDEKGHVVWKPREVWFNGTEAASNNMVPQAGAVFVDRHRKQLIQRFYSVMEVTDCLKSKNIITDEMYSNIQAKSTSQAQMRELYKCLDSAGRAAKEEFYDILENNYRWLVDDLKSGSGQA